MESTVEPLHYQSLESQHIRIFGINPGRPDEDITGTLIEQNLDALDHERHPFSALSYIWGDDIDQVSAIVATDAATEQTGTVTITTSLWTALRNFRNTLNQTWVWVDQICIDQSNDTEKGEQILLLRLIYQRAKWVVAIVENRDDNDLAMDLLEGDEWSRIVPFSNAMNVALARLGQEPTAKNRGDAFQAMNSLLSQRYWKRTWVWQEVTANPDDSLVRYGTKQVRLHNMMLYVISYKQYTAAGVEKDTDWDRRPIWAMTPFLDFWGIRKVGRESSLLGLLDAVRGAEITDPRDKVFAVLPFSTDAIQDFRPTYQTRTHVLYTYVVLWHVVKYQNLNILAFSKGDFGRFPVDHRHGRITTHVGEPDPQDEVGPKNEFEPFTLASWVPDWRAKSPTLHSEPWKADLRLHPLPKSEHIYDPTLPQLFTASGAGPPDMRFTFPESPTFINGLTVYAVKIATIVRVHRDKMPSDVGLEVEEDWYREFQAANISNWDHSGDHLFKRTIYADLNFRSVRNVIRYTRASSIDEELVWPNITQVQDPLLQLGNLKHITRNRVPFRTKATSDTTTGLYGLGPAWARRGDEVWILKGASVPFVLRPGAWTAESGSTNANLITGTVDKVMYQRGDKILTFVGECFVLGLMNGEVLALMQSTEDDPRRTQVPELEREFHPITLF